MLICLFNRDKLNETFDMNVTNVHNVTRAFLPLLRKSQKKTVVNMYVLFIFLLLCSSQASVLSGF